MAATGYFTTKGTKEERDKESLRAIACDKKMLEECQGWQRDHRNLFALRVLRG